MDAFQKVADMATNTRGEQMEGCLPALTESSTWALPLGGFSKRYGLSYQSLAGSQFSSIFNAVGLHAGDVVTGSPDSAAQQRLDEKGKEPLFPREVACCGRGYSSDITLGRVLSSTGYPAILLVPLWNEKSWR